MTQLEEDLKTYADDALNKKDAKAAIALIAEICGAGAVIAIAGIVISAIFGPGGVVPAAAGACGYMLKKCTEVYANLPADQRSLVRKLARALHGIVG